MLAQLCVRNILRSSVRRKAAYTYERIPRGGGKEDDVVTSEILTAALNHVNTKGWNEDAIRAGNSVTVMSSHC